MYKLNNYGWKHGYKHILVLVTGIFIHPCFSTSFINVKRSGICHWGPILGQRWTSLLFSLPRRLLFKSSPSFTAAFFQLRLDVASIIKGVRVVRSTTSTMHVVLGSWTAAAYRAVRGSPLLRRRSMPRRVASSLLQFPWLERGHAETDRTDGEKWNMMAAEVGSLDPLVSSTWI